jgi:DNA-binding response OmpR family regulator
VAAGATRRGWNWHSRRLRALPGMADVPLVAVSGYGQAHDRERALAAGFDRHFVKPVMAADILAVLDDLAARQDAGFATSRRARRTSSRRTGRRPSSTP